MSAIPTDTSINPTVRRSQTWGWFGGQVGSTVWLVCVAFRLGWHASPGNFSLLLACFAAANLIGLAFWCQRHRIGLGLALRLMLGAVAACGLIAMISLRSTPEFDSELSPLTFVVFGIVIAVLFVILPRRASGSRDA